MKSEDGMWTVLKKRIILCAPVIFCLFMLFDWMRTTRAGFLYNWDVALLGVGVNIIWTVFLIGISLFFAKKSLRNRSKPTDKGVDPRDGKDKAERSDPKSG
jgi:membrane protein implicated in regulation of membrane protease activity